MSTSFQLRTTLQAIACFLFFFIPAISVEAAEDSCHMRLEPAVSMPLEPGLTVAEQAEFYSQDQGAQLIPLAWLKALKQPTGEPFLADNLSRYGYLPNPASSTGLPIGFSAAGQQGDQVAGLTCAACHTRQVEVDGKAYRFDGGPAIIDIQSFFADLDAAAKRVLDGDAEFQTFAAAVLGSSAPSPGETAALKQKLKAWYLRYDTIMSRALPETPWGPSRLDAVGMIFNRIIGLDIGAPPDYLIADNIQKAKAPVRYPFLWNAPRQDKTQWAGFLNNGSDSLALPRNLGQVYGVFGEFHPVKLAELNLPVLGNLVLIDYLQNNSANFEGLEKLEQLVKRIAPPKWPKEWPLDTKLAELGKEIYNRPKEKGGCSECHGKWRGQVQFPDNETWATPLCSEGTDAAQYDILTWTAKTGVLQGAEIPPLRKPLKETDYALNVLATSVLGSIIQHKLLAPPVTPEKLVGLVQKLLLEPTIPTLEGVKGAFKVAEDLQNLGGSASAPVYEAKVLEGIWAAAPYLHNGSVPTLTELLKPPSERVASFKVGPAYDIVNVGLSADQTKFGYTLKTTDCSDLHSGNSRCGHTWGTTTLKPEEKKALIEYLKTL